MPYRQLMLTKNKRPTILVSAYACCPNCGSEEGVGWNFVINLAKKYNLHILACKKYEERIAEWLACNRDYRESLHFHFVPRLYLTKLEIVWPPSYYWTYQLWQWKAYRYAKRLCNEIEFDLIHQLNMIGYREPGYLWKLDYPFIWGPIGGHVQMPMRFYKILGIRGSLFYGMRNVINWLQMRRSRRVRKAAQRADIIIAATKIDQLATKHLHKRDAVLMNETGTTVHEDSSGKRRWDCKRALKIVWCGLFLPRKALPIALHAVCKVRHELDIELHIVGGGKCERAWKELAVKLNVKDVCRWHGMVSHEEALSIMKQCDVMLFTSLQEGTPHVVLEALGLSLPVICHDACGYGEVINESCGIKVRMDSPARSINDFADALLRIGKSDDLLPKLSDGALSRAHELTWQKKAINMSKLYEIAITNYKRSL